MKKHIKRALVLIVVLVIALAVGIGVILYNPLLIKGPIERNLSEVAGYPISLNGELDIQPGKLTTLTAKTVHVAGPEWSSRPELIVVSHLKLSVVTSSLFKDIVILDSLLVDGLQLNLETNEEGKGNWISANRQPSTAEPVDKESARTVVIFKNIDVSNSSLRFRNGKTDIDHVFNINSLSNHQASDGILHTTLAGDLNDRLVEYAGSIGPYENMLIGQNISYTADGLFGELRVKSHGLIDDLLKPKRPTFSVEIQGPDIDEITAMLGVGDLGSGEFNLRAEGAEAGDHYEADINGKVGDISINATAKASDLSQFSDPSKFNELDLAMAINGPSLGAFTRVFGQEDWPDKPFSLKGGAERIGSTLNVKNLTLNIGGTQLSLDALLTNFPSLEAGRIKLAITGDEIVQFRELLGIPGLATGPFEINGKLDVTKEDVELIQVDMKTSLGQASISGTLGDGANYTGSQLQIHLDGHNAHSLMAVIGIDALPERPFSLNTKFELIENGLQIERGVLATIEDDHLEMGGLITFNPGIEGSDLDIKISGNDLAQMLQGITDTTNIPGRPYDLSGNVKVLEEGLSLENTSIDFEGINLRADGSVNFADKMLGSSLDFKLAGDNFSTLKSFKAIGDSLDIFVPGQPYQAKGRFKVANSGYQFNGVSGQLGKTDLNFDLQISQQAKLAGSSVRFAIEGPGLNELLVENEKFSPPPGAFESKGHVTLSNDSMAIKALHFKNERVRGQADLDLDWPYDKTSNIDFDIHVSGDDINWFLPKVDWFEVETAAFEADAKGSVENDLASLQQLDATIGNLKLSTKSKFGVSPGNESADISFQVFSDDISKIGRLYGEQLQALKLDIKGGFKGDAHQFSVYDLSGSLGESLVNANIDVSLNGPKPDIKLTATSDLIDIRPFQRPGKPDDDKTTPVKKDRLIPATQLPLDALAAADVLIEINIKELRHLEDSINNVVIDTEVKDGVLNVPQMSFEAPMGDMKTSFSITPTQAGKADVIIELDAENLVLNTSGLPREKLDQIPALKLDFKLNGTGGNYQEVAGSLNGAFYLESDGGTLEGVNLSVLDTFVLDEIFNAMMPKSDRADDLTLICAATILTFTDGLIETKPGIAFTTDQVAIIAKGNLDLKTEKMHFNFNATPTNALKISASELFNPYVLVKGTLSKPEVGVDPQKAILHGGAAIGTAGISILAKGLIDRVGTAIPLCEEMQKTVKMEKSARGQPSKRRK